MFIVKSKLLFYNYRINLFKKPTGFYNIVGSQGRSEIGPLEAIVFKEGFGYNFYLLVLIELGT